MGIGAQLKGSIGFPDAEIGRKGHPNFRLCFSDLIPLAAFLHDVDKYDRLRSKEWRKKKVSTTESGIISPFGSLLTPFSPNL